MKRLIFASMMLLGTFGALELSTRPAQAVDCSLVRCMACPEGQHPKLTPPNCCKCVKD